MNRLNIRQSFDGSNFRRHHEDWIFTSAKPDGRHARNAGFNVTNNITNSTLERGGFLRHAHHIIIMALDDVEPFALMDDEEDEVASGPPIDGLAAQPVTAPMLIQNGLILPASADIVVQEEELEESPVYFTWRLRSFNLLTSAEHLGRAPKMWLLRAAKERPYVCAHPPQVSQVPYAALEERGCRSCRLPSATQACQAQVCGFAYHGSS